MASLGGSRLTLTQAKAIKENQYRSSNNQRDYQPEEVDARILELQARADERFIKRLMRKACIPNAYAAKLVREGITAAKDWKNSPDEYWKRSCGEFIAIPPRIMEF